MRVFKVAFLLAVSLLVLLSCQGQTVKPQRLTPDNFEATLNSVKEKTLLDVRTAEEFAEGHLDKAVLIDFYGNDFKANVSKLDKTKPVFVYCGTGRRSRSAADIMVQMGFKQVYDLDGGITAWADVGKKIVK